MTLRMRTSSDRLRHTLLFEIIGLLTCTPLAAWVLDRELFKIGTMAAAISLTAMICNFVFNLAFDHALLRLGRPLNVRPPWMRLLHTCLFETFLLCFTLPMIAWWLDMTIWQAFIADIVFVSYFLVYTYVFNWAYDRVFPIPVETAGA